MVSAKTVLSLYKEKIDIELRKYLSRKIKEADKISPYAGEVIEHVADLTLRGGKRIRPALFYYSFLAHGGKDRKRAVLASLAIEMSETYLLIHDDIMDDDELRRGGVTIHESYSRIADEKFKTKSNPRLFGSSMAINAGDIACAMSNEILVNSGFKADLIVKAINELNKTYIKECYGQTLDVYSQLRDDVEPDDVILVHELKTVPYTFDGPLKIGAILAGANEKDLKKLSDFAVPLGTAFQIQDDILGMFSSEEKLGKPVTSDLKEGKKTLLILDALKVADKKQKEIIESNLGNKNVSLTGLRAVRRVVEETGSLERSKKLAEKLVSKAMKALDSLKLEKEGKEFLLGIDDYMIKRDY